MNKITSETIKHQIVKDYEQSQDWLLCLNKYTKRIKKAENDSNTGRLLREDAEKLFDLGYAFFIYQLIEKKVSINEFEPIIQKIYEHIVKEQESIGFVLKNLMSNDFNDYIDRDDVNYQAFFNMSECFLAKTEEFGNAEVKQENLPYLLSLFKSLPIPEKKNKHQIDTVIRTSGIIEIIADCHNDVAQLTPLFDIASIHAIFKKSNQDNYDFWKEAVEKIVYNIDKDNDIEKNKRTYQLFLNNTQLKNAALDLIGNAFNNLNPKMILFCAEAKIDFFSQIHQTIDSKFKEEEGRAYQSKEINLSHIKYHHTTFRSNLFILDEAPDFYLDKKSIHIGKSILDNWTLLNLMEIKLVNEKEINLSLSQQKELLHILENIDMNDKIEEYLAQSLSLDKINTYLRYHVFNHEISTNNKSISKPKL